MRKPIPGKRQGLVLLFWSVAMFFMGCRTLAPDVREKAHIIEDFEHCGLWSIDSANNYGEVDYATGEVLHGQYALRAIFHDSGRGYTIFRKEVDYDLSLTDRLWIDVLNLNPGSDISCALAFRTAMDRFYETRLVPLRRGWNIGLKFDLGPKGMKKGTDLTAWQAERSQVTRIMIFVFPGQNKTGTLTFDRLRAERPGVNRMPRPFFLAGVPPQDTVRQWQPQEAILEFAADSLRMGSTLSGRETWAAVEVMARLTSPEPEGSSREVKGFLKDVVGPKPRKLVYAVRFTPTVPGRWHVAIAYRAERRWQTVFDQFFTVKEAPEAEGMVTVDPGDPAYLRLSSGKPFYPIGQNVCWAGDYKPYLDAIHRYGGNLVRVWICPWNFPLLDRNLDQINLASASEIDRLFALALERGIYIQLVLAYHGWFTSDWNRNPFNAALGGPCKAAEDFWTDARAREKFKMYLDYVVRRWAAWPNLFAWELLNEADLATWRWEDDVVEWHREMSEYLRKTDPYRHLITSSTASPLMLTDMWSLPAIDLVTSHLYTPNPARDIPETWRRLAVFGKPYFIAEFGRGAAPADDQVDPEGRILHQALWLAGMTPSAGNCLPWWWDTFIAPNNLYYHFKAIVNFMRDEDRRGLDLRHWTAELKQGDRVMCEFHGLVGRDRVYGFVFDPRRSEEPGIRSPLPVLPQPCRLVFNELEDGIYEVELWDTYRGEVQRKFAVQSNRGQLAIELGPSEEDFAFKAGLNKEAAKRSAAALDPR